MDEKINHGTHGPHHGVFCDIQCLSWFQLSSGAGIGQLTHLTRNHVNPHNPVNHYDIYGKKVKQENENDVRLYYD